MCTERGKPRCGKVRLRTERNQKEIKRNKEKQRYRDKKAERGEREGESGRERKRIN